MLRRDKLLLYVIGAAVAFGTYLGWKAFLFTTDDAYIAFRYVSNSMAGHGFVWNPPPFRPVEGYTSFLWVALLRGVWHVFGLEPPVVANTLLLLFGYATLFLGYRFIARMHLPEHLTSHRLVFLALLMLGTMTNRTFLTWLSSGLETAMFNFLFTWWIYEGTASSEHRGRGWGIRLSLSAVLLALTRPDGLLAVAATPLLLLFLDYNVALQQKNVMKRAGSMLRSLKHGWLLLFFPLFLLWRKATYGEWLPNTYYAKMVSPWPESGARYFASFVLEYGIWVWFIVSLSALILVLSKPQKNDGSQSGGSSKGNSVWVHWFGHLPIVITVCVVVAHVGYYTFIVGGDHFEYRVYSYLILLLFVSSLWALATLVRHLTTHRSFRLLGVYCGLILFIVSSYPIPWIHWNGTRHIEERKQSFRLIYPVAPHFPQWIRPVVSEWDAWQKWLIHRSVCMRHQEHKVFFEDRKAWLPARSSGIPSDLKGQGMPVIANGLVGILGWVLPDVAVVDKLGLNDYVIARNPELPKRKPNEPKRQMAHDRRPPPKYIKCFRPNLVILPREGIRTKPRKRPLWDQDIQSCETRSWY